MMSGKEKEERKYMRLTKIKSWRRKPESKEKEYEVEKETKEGRVIGHI